MFLADLGGDLLAPGPHGHIAARLGQHLGERGAPGTGPEHGGPGHPASSAEARLPAGRSYSGGGSSPGRSSASRSRTSSMMASVICSSTARLGVASVQREKSTGLPAMTVIGVRGLIL